MSHASLTPEMLRRAAEALSRIPRGDVQLASKIVGEVLFAQAEQRSAAVSHAFIDARMGSHGATDATAEVDGIRPMEVLRHGPRTVRERAVVSVLLALHLGTLLERDGGLATVRALLPGLDWLEFTGPYAPYSAARVVLPADTLARFEALLRAAPVEASSPSAAAAVRALRSVSAPDRTETGGDGSGHLQCGGRQSAVQNITLAGEVEGIARGWLSRAMGICTGWSALRGAIATAARVLFSFRRPMTLSLEGERLRVLGHTEIVGRTLRTFDIRYPLAELVEIRREARYPLLPAALSLVAFGLGVTLGARAVIEGAGVRYFPLVAIGLGAILLGLVFDLLMRALFPGLRGRTRLVIRARDGRALVLTGLPVEEVDRLLDAVDARFGVAQREASPPSTGPAVHSTDPEVLPVHPTADR